MDWEKQSIRRRSYRIPNKQQHQNSHHNRKTRKHKTEIISIRIYLKRKETLFTGLFYGKQESRNNNITLGEKFNIAERHLYQYTANNQKHILLLGNFNAKTENREQGISNGDAKLHQMVKYQ